MIRILTVLLLLSASVALGQTRDEKVRGDREKVTKEGFWIYNDLSAAFNQAKAQNKPIIVVLRCIPCEECVKLDDELLDNDPELRPLLEKFVRARQVSTNGLNLDLFQYDTDQSFAVFLLNADGTIYSRFGTRSHRTEWFGDVSIKGLTSAMRRTLELHQNYPANQSLFVGKRGKPLEASSPEKFPSLKDKFTDRLNYQGNVVKSCIHCHQIGDARREWYRNAGKPIPQRLVFPYPHPKILGLTIDPDLMGSVREVADQSIASAAGLTAGDVIKTMNGQAILSIADMQWVLENVDPVDAEASVSVTFDRDGENKTTSLTLPHRWREQGDISWRVSSWPYRRMVTGGMLLESLNNDRRNKLSIAKDAMALRVKHVGKYGPHAAAKKAGVKQDDVVVQYNGRTDLLSDSALLAYGIKTLKIGDKIKVKLLRGGVQKTVTIPIQK